jgi:membrane protein implicated in regulation of membrane protease activity
MDTVLEFLNTLNAQQWAGFGAALLVIELFTGTTYVLWPAVAAFVVALASTFGLNAWPIDVALFAVLTIVLTAFAHPIVKRWRLAQGGRPINERAHQMIGTRGMVTAFANGVGSVKINDSIWRAVSSEPLVAGEQVEIAEVHGTTVTVKKLA